MTTVTPNRSRSLVFYVADNNIYIYLYISICICVYYMVNQRGGCNAEILMFYNRACS
jgi:hypothetical protein